MNLYCVYLTIYRGNKNKMPPLYIGSTSIKKLNTGYHGSVSSKKWKETWKSELKDNSHLFETKIVCTHSTRQEALDKEYKLQVALDILKKPEMYINRAVANVNGYFGMSAKGIDSPNTGKIRSEEYRKRKSESMLGISRTKESKEKQSQSVKGKNNHTYGKLKELSNNYGKIWITNGVDIKLIYVNDNLPEGWHKGKRRNSDDARKKISIALSGTNHPGYGKIWITNGEINKRIYPTEIIPIKWYRGKS